MDGADPVDMGLVLYLGLKGFRQFGKGCLCLNQVYDSQKAVGVKYFFDVRTNLVGEDGENTNHLTAFFCFELAYAVVGFHYLGRFYKDGFSCSTLIVHNAIDLTFQSGGYRNHQTTVAHGGRSVLVYQSVALGGMQYRIEGA